MTHPLGEPTPDEPVVVPADVDLTAGVDAAGQPIVREWDTPVDTPPDTAASARSWEPYVTGRHQAPDLHDGDYSAKFVEQGVAVPDQVVTERVKAVVAGQPTQVRFSGKAVLRTAVQVGVPTLVSALAVIPLIIEAIIGYVPAALRAWLLAAGAAVTAAAAGLARVMAIPAVNTWLKGYGLGATPSAKAVEK